jgi:hypothetical protein
VFFCLEKWIKAHHARKVTTQKSQKYKLIFTKNLVFFRKKSGNTKVKRKSLLGSGCGIPLALHDQNSVGANNLCRKDPCAESVTALFAAYLWNAGIGAWGVE